MCCPCVVHVVWHHFIPKSSTSFSQVSWSVLWLCHQLVTDVTAWQINPNLSCSKNRKSRKRKIKWKEKIKIKSTINNLDTCVLLLSLLLIMNTPSFLVQIISLTKLHNPILSLSAFSHLLSFWKYRSTYKTFGEPIFGFFKFSYFLLFVSNLPLLCHFLHFYCFLLFLLFFLLHFVFVILTFPTLVSTVSYTLLNISLSSLFLSFI